MRVGLLPFRSFCLPRLSGHANNARAMATVFTNSTIQDESGGSEYREDEAPFKETPLFRFRLRQLLGFMAAVCGFLAALASVGGLTCLVLVVAGAVIFMHVFATALSHRLQARTESERRLRQSLYLPWLTRFVMVAMLFGGLAGTLFLSGMLGDRTSPEGILVGALSFAVLGGWVSFLGGNFYGVFRHGFREALAEEQKDHLTATPAQR
jgi:hypothetical protein